MIDKGLPYKLESLHLIQRYLTKGFVPDVDIEMKRREGRTLIALWHEEGHSMSYYTNRVDLESGSFTSLIDRLVKKDLVYREQDPADRRAMRLRLTESGHRTANEIHSQYCRFLQERLDILSPSQQERLRQAVSLIDEINKEIEQHG